MKKIVYLLLLLLIFVGCKQEITNKDILKINGYWEIEKVILEDGKKKDYKVNQTIDYFQLKNKKGFRKKVMPQMDGTYLINDVKEDILVSNQNNRFYINYSTQYTKWREEIIEIQDSILVLKSNENIEYHYKKQIPFSLK